MKKYMVWGLIVVYSLLFLTNCAPDSQSEIASTFSANTTSIQSQKQSSDSQSALPLFGEETIDFYSDIAQGLTIGNAQEVRQASNILVMEDALLYIAKQGKEYSVCSLDIQSQSVTVLFSTKEYVINSFLYIDEDRLLIEVQYLSSTLPGEYPVPICFLYLYTISTGQLVSINEQYDLQKYYPEMSTFVGTEEVFFDGPPEYFYAYSNSLLYMLIYQNNAEANGRFMLRIGDDGSVVRLPWEFTNFGWGQQPIVDGNNLYIFDHESGTLYAYLDQSEEAVRVLKCNGNDFRVPYIINGTMYLEMGGIENGLLLAQIDLYEKQMKYVVAQGSNENIIPIGDMYCSHKYEYDPNVYNSPFTSEQCFLYSWSAGIPLYKYEPFENPGYNWGYVFKGETLYYLTGYDGDISLEQKEPTWAYNPLG